MAAIGRTTEWHEGHQKNEVLQRNKGNEKAIMSELKLANAELKNLKHERIAQLYKADAQSYEAELNSMGFAIYMDRLWM